MRVCLHVIGARAERGWLRSGSLYLPCAIGKGGVRVLKREGDGATPAGVLTLTALYYRRDRRLPPPSPHHRRALKPSDGWCDDPSASSYNRLIKLPVAPAAAVRSYEEMCRKDRLYDVVGVLDYNLRPALRGRGSAIFLHQTRDATLPPTAGCLALNPRDLSLLLARHPRLTLAIAPFPVRPSGQLSHRPR